MDKFFEKLREIKERGETNLEGVKTELRRLQPKQAKAKYWRKRNNIDKLKDLIDRKNMKDD